MTAKRVERCTECYEIAGNKPCPLMNQLIERVLTVRARFAPVDRAGLIVNLHSVKRNIFAIAFHSQLLKICRKTLEILLVGQNCDSVNTKKTGIPDGQQGHEHRQVAVKRSGAKVLVHLVKSVQHRPEVVRSDGKHCRKPDCGVHRIPPADPIPEFEHISGIDTKLRHLVLVCRNSDKVLRYGLFIAAKPLQQPRAGGACIRHGLQGGKCF